MPKRTKSRKKFLIIAAIAVVVAALLAVWFWQKDDKSLDTQTASSNSQATKGEPSASEGTQSSGSTGGTDTSQPGDQKSESGGSSSQTLLAPSGNFVSNHHPGEGGSPTSETSVCTTTPGATCKITFTKDGVTKSLSVQSVDRGGSAYWNGWTPSDAGLSSGSWQVKAVATLNGQSESTTDAIELVVQ
jgi:hypothetical protein